MHRIADHVSRVPISPSVAMLQRAREMSAAGRDVVVLCAGEPDFDTPAPIREAAVRAIAAGHTRYTAVDGIAELKAAVCEKFRRENGLEFGPDQVCISAGGKQAIFNALFATLNPGDEVLVPAPYWVSYPDIATLCGARTVILPTTMESGFKLDPDRLGSAITEKTRWLVLNNPGNPSGAVYTADELEAIAHVLRRHEHVAVMSDDIYEHIVFAPARFDTMAAVAPDIASRVLTVNGVSKTFAMTGWRIGYAAGDAGLLRAMRAVQSQSSGNPASISQWAAVAALASPADFLPEAVLRFQARRDRLVAALNDMPGIRCATPQGAFYVYPDVGGCIGRITAGGRLIANDQDFADALLDEQGVALVHGAAYGLSPHVRVSFAAAEDALDEACRRLLAFCGSLSTR